MMPGMAIRRCWNCDAVAHMTRIGNARWIDPPDSDEIQATYECDECHYLQIARIHAGQGRGQNPDAEANGLIESADDRSWWPQVGVSRDFPDIPGPIAEAASEAHRCFSIQAYRATASLARAVVEATAKAKGITGGQIKSKIDKLYSENHIRLHVRDAAHEIRYLGNEAAHGDFVDPLTDVEAEELLELMAEVLQEVFQSPARVARMAAAREARRAEANGES